jgi:hypothetical protein
MKQIHHQAHQILIQIPKVAQRVTAAAVAEVVVAVSQMGKMGLQAKRIQKRTIQKVQKMSQLLMPMEPPTVAVAVAAHLAME